MILGAIVNGDIATLGEKDVYTFSAQSGQQLLFDSLAGTNGLMVTISSANGQNFVELSFGFDGLPIAISESGIYHLSVFSQIGGNVTGNYMFRLLDLATSHLVTLGATVSATLSPGTSTDLYRFNGTGGQRIYLQNSSPLSAVDSESSITVFDSNGRTVAQSRLRFEFGANAAWR
jgi:hypothetical protein